MSDVRGHDKNVLETALQDVNLVLILSHRQYTSILNYDSGLVLCIYIFLLHIKSSFLSQSVPLFRPQLCPFSDPSSAPFQIPALPLFRPQLCPFGPYCG